MSRTLVRLVVTMALLISGGVGVYLLVLREDPVPVTVFVTARGPVEATVTNSKAGTLKSRRRATLSPEIGGRVVELNVREGARVSGGDVLMRISDRDLRAQVVLSERTLAAVRATRAEACLAAEQAQREHQRYLALEQDRIVSAELLDRLGSRSEVAQASCAAAGARTAEAEAGLDLARVNLDKAVLRAPFDAVVAEVSTELGEWITPSPPGLPIPAVIELLEPSALYVSAAMDEVDMGKVRAGQPVRVTMDSRPGRPIEGRVTRIAPYVLDLEEHSRTFEIEIAIDLDDAAPEVPLLPGSSADVEVILDSRPDVLRVPSYALIEGNRVLLFRDGVLETRQVETGLSNWAFTEVTRGLVAGERVVVSLDRVEVKEGARAVVVEETKG